MLFLFPTHDSRMGTLPLQRLHVHKSVRNQPYLYMVFWECISDSAGRMETPEPCSRDQPETLSSDLFFVSFSWSNHIFDFERRTPRITMTARRRHEDEDPRSTIRRREAPDEDRRPPTRSRHEFLERLVEDLQSIDHEAPPQESTANRLFLAARVIRHLRETNELMRRQIEANQSPS